MTPELVKENHIQSALDFSALWNRTYGGLGTDRFYDMTQCADGGFAIVGATYSFDTYGGDIWVVRTNYDGNVMWTTTLYENVTTGDLGKAIVECENGDFLVAGASSSSDYDARVERIDADGNSIWSRLIGLDGTVDFFDDVIETSSGNILAVGYTKSWGAGGYDVLAVCLASNGNNIWTRVYGDVGDDLAREIVECANGGFAIVAETSSYGAGAVDFWLLRIDEDGNLLWEQTQGTTSSEIPNDLIECSTGGFLMVGSTSFGAPGGDFLAVRVDDLGFEIWNQTYPGAASDFATEVVEAANGGFAIAGISDYTSGVDKARLIRIEPDGTQRWSNWYTGPSIEYAYGLIETYPEEFVIAGWTYSYGAGNSDGWLVLVPGEPRIIDPPDEIHFEFGQGAGVTLWAESSSPIHMWWLSSTTVPSEFNIAKIGAHEGTVYRLLPPDVGYYEIYVQVNNTAGHATEHIFIIYVEDTIAPNWDNFTGEHTLEFGEQFQYTPLADDLSALGDWSLTGSDDFTIDTNEGEITSVGTPAVGDYYLEISVGDIYGNTLIDDIHVTVQDTTAPEWSSVLQDQEIQYGGNFMYDLNATDRAGISTWKVDNSEFSVDSGGRVRNLITLAPGIHAVTITVTDVNGNELQGQFIVTVNTPLMTTGPSGGGTPSIFDNAIPFALGVVATIAVILVVYLISRRKPVTK